MKTAVKMLSIVALLAMIAACATTTTTTNLPDKYNLDDNLKDVDLISAIGVSNWNQMDEQSVMVTTNGKFYLLVLDKPLEAMGDQIGFRDRSMSIRAGYSKIYVGISADRRIYTIEKIFELDGGAQAKEIKERLGKN